jgi:hypothetical protein
MSMMITGRSVPRGFAFDRSSVRRWDTDGCLHVGSSVLTAVGTSKYWGSEIPDFQRLGLAADETYQLFRPPAELEKAAPGLVGKPVLSRHRPQTAADHARELTIGCVGEPVIFDGTNIWGGLTIWDEDEIALIESGEKRCLSAGYRYRACPQTGTFDGVRYTHVMRDICFNHVAVVPIGRVPNAIVGDALPRNFMEARKNMSSSNESISVTAPKYRSDWDCFTAISAFLAEKLSPDDLSNAQDLLAELVAELTGDNPNGLRLAADAAGRRTRVRQAISSASYAARFPDSGRLNR